MRSGGGAVSARREWWRGASIYQIYPRSFADSNGDGIGDLPGITAHLAYVASLGVDAIWLCPFFSSPMRDFGYDVADYCSVDPSFGTLQDFDHLLERAHTLGLLVQAEPRGSHQFQGRVVCMGRSQSGRLASFELAVGVRGPRLGVGCAPRAVLSS